METAKNNNNKRFSGAEELEGIDLRNLDIYDIKNKNYLGSGAFGDVYYVRDINGEENQDYAVKSIRKHNFVITKGLRKVFGNKLSFIEDIDKTFRKEVKTLFDLKNRDIGPEIVYANYTKNYYVTERMTDTLNSILTKNVFTPIHALMFLALVDRYLRCEYYHEDFHLNNIMWSEKLGDFRIIDWGIGLRIGKMPEEKREWWIKDRVKSLFDGGTFWVCMVYIKDCIETEKDETELEKWMLMSEKYSEWIKSWWISNKEELKLEPEWVEEYDIFSDKFKRSEKVEETQKLIKNVRVKAKKSSPKTTVLSGRLRLRKKSRKKKSKKKK